MTTPGGVPNLPLGALTLGNLESSTQDMSGDAMKTRAVERFPSIFDLSTGLSPASDLTPLGILTRIWAEVNSLIANADPADIQGPDDLPELVLDFISGLPVVGQFVGVLEAILGTYEGDDPVLLTVQEIFAPIRALMQLVSGIGGGDWPSLDELLDGWDLSRFGDLGALLDGFVGGDSILGQIIGAIPGVGGSPTGLGGLGDIFTDWMGLLGSPSALGTGSPSLPGVGSIPLLGGLFSGGNFLTSLIPILDASKIGTGTFADGFLPGLGGLRDAIYQAAHGGSTTGTTAGQAKTALTDIFAGFLTAFQPSATPTNVALTDVATLGGAIRTAVTAGYTVSIFAATNAAWTIPTGTTEIIGIVVDGGNRGQTGNTGLNTSALGGLGGSDGGYLSAPLDLTGLTAGTSTLNVVVGAAAASPGGTGGVSSISATTGTLLTGAAGANGIYSTQGLLLSTSQPGAGGKGGDGDGPAGTATAGTAGTASGLGGAGTGGTSRTTNSNGTAGAGTNGAAGQTSNLPIVGGSGGGGGGGAACTGSFNITGGAGGNGGYPGGGSGGGGAASGGTAFGTKVGGAPGTPGNGIVVLIHK